MAARPARRNSGLSGDAFKRGALAILLGLAATLDAHEGRPIRIGLEVNSPPLSFVNPQGQPEGFTIELLREAGRVGGIEFEFVHKYWLDLTVDFAAGRIDALGNVVISEERRATMDFSLAHASLHGTAYTRQGAPVFTHTSELVGRKIAMLEGSVAYLDAVSHRAWGGQIVPFRAFREVLGAVHSGQCDLALVLRPLAFEQPDEMGLHREFVDDITYQFRIAVHHGDRLTLERLNDALAAVRQSGAFDRLYAKWIGPIEPHPIRLSDLRPYLLPAAVAALLLILLFVWQRRVNTVLSRQAAALHDSEEKYRVVVQNAHEMIFVLQDGVLRFVNATAQRLLGLEEAQLRERPFLDFTAPDARPEIIRTYRQLLAGEITDARGEYLVMLPLGGERWLEITGIRILWQNRPATLNFATDITAAKQAELARRDAAERLRIIASRVPGFVFQYRLLADRTGSFPYVSDGIANVFRLTPADVHHEADRVFTLIHPDDLASVHAAREQSAHALTPWHQEFRIVFADGTLRWVGCDAVPQREGDGAVLWHGFMSDVTAHRQAAQALQFEQDRISRIFQSAPVGLATLHDRVLKEVNGVFCAITGYAREDVIGRDTRWLYAEEREYERVGGMILQKVVAQGHGATETQWRRRDGNVIQVLVSVSLLRLEGTRPVVITAVLDISERKRIENALHESNEQLRRAQEVARLGSYEFDMTRDHWDSSPQLDTIFGIDGNHVRNAEGWLDLVAPDQRAEMRDYLQRHVVGERRRFDKEYRIVRRSDRQERWVNGLGELAFDAAGRPVRLVGTIQDITERKALESQLRQAQKMEVVGQLAGGIAHDFNNILTAMTLNLELMRQMALPAEARSSVGEVEALARRAARLTQQMLMFARQQSIHLTTVEVNSAMAGLVKMLRRLLGEPIALNFVAEAPTLWIEADPGMLDQAVMNLCINARDAMPHGGRLTLATEKVTIDDAAAGSMPDARPGRFACLTVSDTGCGMPPEVVQHLFEPFFTTKDVGKGTGLGLASVHGIVHQHHGWITVESAVDRGTTFRIFLPCSVQAEAAAAAAAAAHDPTTPGGRETILLVEDEAIVRHVTTLLLQQLGYRVFAAADGKEALRLGTEHLDDIALVLADMVMPGGLTGLQVGQELRTRKPGLKIVIVSGYSSEIIRGESLATLGVTFLPKPFESTILAQTLRRCLDES